MTKSQYITQETIVIIERAKSDGTVPNEYKQHSLVLDYMHEVLLRDPELQFFWWHKLTRSGKMKIINAIVDATNV